MTMARMPAMAAMAIGTQPSATLACRWRARRALDQDQIAFAAQIRQFGATHQQQQGVADGDGDASQLFTYRGAAPMQRQHQRVLMQLHAQRGDGFAGEARIGRYQRLDHLDLAAFEHLQLGHEIRRHGQPKMLAEGEQIPG
jgi:hypothetical protein